MNNVLTGFYKVKFSLQIERLAQGALTPLPQKKPKNGGWPIFGTQIQICQHES